MIRRSFFILVAIVASVAVFNMFFGQGSGDYRNIKKHGVIYDRDHSAARKNHAAALKEPGKQAPLFMLVIDDMGYTEKNLAAIAGLGIDINLAVLPGAPFTKDVCRFCMAHKYEIILHMPMEPEKKSDYLEKGTILDNMDAAEIKGLLRKALDSVSPAKGISNHMGSKITGDERIMDIVLSEARDNGLYFLDSFTTPKTVAAREADKKGVLYIRRDIFIDNTADVSYMEKQISRAGREALDKGYVAAIGHDKALTIKVLGEMVPRLEKKGIKFITISDYLKKR